MEIEEYPILILSQSGAAEEDVSWIDKEGKFLFISLESLEELQNKLPVFESYCNGLLSFRVDHHRQAFLINPLREEAIFLREPPQSEFLQTDGLSYGLGVGGSSGAYKLVFLEHTKIEHEGKWSYNVRAKVLTLGSSKWRDVWNVPRVLYANQPIFENGFLYWLSGKKGSQKLLAFDVENEVFSAMETPSLVDKIVDLGGHLGLLYAAAQGFEVTVSSSHNAQGRISRWRKEGPILIADEDGKYIDSSNLMVLGTWKDSTVLIKWLQQHRVFVSYDFMSKSVTKVNYPERAMFEYNSFKASLLTLADFHGSSDLLYLPPEQSYNSSRSGLIQKEELKQG